MPKRKHQPAGQCHSDQFDFAIATFIDAKNLQNLAKPRKTQKKNTVKLGKPRQKPSKTFFKLEIELELQRIEALPTGRRKNQTLEKERETKNQHDTHSDATERHTTSIKAKWQRRVQHPEKASCSHPTLHHLEKALYQPLVRLGRHS